MAIETFLPDFTRIIAKAPVFDEKDKALLLGVLSGAANLDDWKKLINPIKTSWSERRSEVLYSICKMIGANEECLFYSLMTPVLLSESREEWVYPTLRTLLEDMKKISLIEKIKKKYSGWTSDKSSISIVESCNKRIQQLSIQPTK